MENFCNDTILSGVIEAHPIISKVLVACVAGTLMHHPAAIFHCGRVAMVEVGTQVWLDWGASQEQP